MNRNQFIVVLVITMFMCPLISNAGDVADRLTVQPSSAKPFFGYKYENIKWVEHSRDALGDQGVENADEAYRQGQTDIGLSDLDGDGKDETLKVIWGGGVSDHSLKIEVLKDEKVVSTLHNEFGIQPNFKVEDVDNDGKKEIIIWSGLWDFRLPGEDGVTEETCEGHSQPHRYVVATYKLMRGEHYLWDAYTTKKKYEPFCEEQPIG